MSEFYLVSADGSAHNGHGKKTGCGVVVEKYVGSVLDSRKFYLRADEQGTSCRAELLAIVTGLQLVPIESAVRVLSDSQYSVNSLNCHLTTPLSPNSVNYDLISTAAEVIRGRDLTVVVQWVRGHSGDPLNEVCDFLAGYARTVLSAESKLSMKFPGALDLAACVRAAAESLNAKVPKVFREGN